MAGFDIHKHWLIVILAVLVCMAVAAMPTFLPVSTPARANGESLPLNPPQVLPAKSIAAEEKPLKPESAGEAHPISVWEYDQVNPSVAFSVDSGRFMVVWEDHYYGSGTDWDIFGRMVSLTGDPVGSEFGIAWETANHRLRPDVVYNSVDHEFLVVYEYEYTATDHDIHARRVASNGTLIGGELTIADIPKNETHPVVAFNPTDNQYLVVWQRWEGDIEFGNNDIYGQLLNASGGLLGSSIPIKTGSYNQITPSAAYFTSLNQYSVLWVDDAAPLYPRIYEQRFDSSGAKVGDEINSTGFGANFKPNMVYNPVEDEYAFVFENKTYGSPDRMTGYVDLEALGVGGWGGPIDWDPPYDEYEPDIAYNALVHNYAIVWESAYSVSDHDIFMELYQKITGHFCCTHIGPSVVSNLATWEGNPAVASSNGPSSLVVWEDQRNAGNGMDIYGAVIWHGRANLPLIRGGG